MTDYNITDFLKVETYQDAIDYFEGLEDTNDYLNERNFSGITQDWAINSIRQASGLEPVQDPASAPHMKQLRELTDIVDLAKVASVWAAIVKTPATLFVYTGDVVHATVNAITGGGAESTALAFNFIEAVAQGKAVPDSLDFNAAAKVVRAYAEGTTQPTPLSRAIDEKLSEAIEVLNQKYQEESGGQYGAYEDELGYLRYYSYVDGAPGDNVFGDGVAYDYSRDVELEFDAEFDDQGRLVNSPRPPTRPGEERTGGDVTSSTGISIAEDLLRDVADALRPIVLDLDGDGIELTSNAGTSFDWDGDGYMERGTWAGEDDGMLVVDLAADGTLGAADGIIDQGAEIEWTQWSEEASTDLEALALAFDDNNDNVIDSEDSIWTELRIWRDVNGNGRTDAGELRTLADWGISEIGLLYDDGSSYSDETDDASLFGNTLHGLASFVHDGSEIDVAPGSTAVGGLYTAVGGVGDVTIGYNPEGWREVETALGYAIEFETGATHQFANLSREDVTENNLNLNTLALDGATGNDNANVLVATGHSRSVRISGHDGNDTISGGGNDDALSGDAGADHIRGDDGNDLLFVDAADFASGFVDGGSGRDTAIVVGEDAVDVVLANHGLESISGARGNDALSGVGQSIAVAINGNEGNDTITGGQGEDNLRGDEGDDVISGGDSADFADGGAGDDEVSGGGGDDMLVGGAGKDQITGGTGDDTLLGGDGNDTLYGHEHDDVIDGGNGNDVLDGGSNDDDLNGGAGNDTLLFWHGDDDLHGGTGDDTFTLGTAASNVGQDHAHWSVIQGGAGFDTFEIAFDVANFDQNSLLHVGGNQWQLFLVSLAGGHVIVDLQDVEQLTYADGTSVSLSTDTDLDSSENFIRSNVSGHFGDETWETHSVGWYGTRHIYVSTRRNGSDGDNERVMNTRWDYLFNDSDPLHGWSGDDVLYGSNGLNDTIYGGSGDDAIYGGQVYDSVVLASGVAATWHEHPSHSAAVAADNYGGGNDRLYGHGGDDQLYGGIGNDTLFGGTGADILFGSTGGDILYGEQGSDVLDGGDGNDSLHGQTGEDTLSGGAGNDQAWGGDSRDFIYGGAGNDTLNGNTGDDFLSGNDGDDKLYAGLGSDDAYGGAGNDTIYGNQGFDILYGGDGNDLIKGGEDDDWLFGESGNDTLQGGAGSDVLHGGEGADLINGGQGLFDFVSYAASAEAINVQLLNGTALGGDAAGDTISKIENIIGSEHNDTIHGSHADNLIDGGDGNDRLHGQSGHNTLIGGKGNDIITATAGQDSLFGGEGKDILIGGAGADFLDGGEGRDRAQYHTATSSVLVDLADTSRNLGDAAGDVFVSIEDAHGGNHNDSLYGTESANRLWGHGGNDVIYGRSGNDTIYGQNGDDVIVGGAGNDYLDGGYHADRFVFADGFGNDVVAGFDASTGGDVIDLSGVSSIANFADLIANHVTQSGADSVIDDGDGNSIALKDVSIGLLTADDFAF